jgi:predicted nucleic acid-binding protein
MGIIDSISGRDIYFDTNIFIYIFEGFSEYSQILQPVFTAIDQDRFTAYTSELTLAELLVKPLLDGNQQLVDVYFKILPAIQGLSLLPVARDVLVNAARLRAQHGAQVGLPDAIHLATAAGQGCSCFLTNDKRLRNRYEMSVIVLDDHLQAGG